MSSHFARVRRGVDRRTDAVARERFALALQGDPFDMRRHLRQRSASQFVVGAEHVEHGRRIGQQMLAALFRQADRVRQHHHRVDFRAVGDRIETASVGEFAGQRLRRLDEAGAQRTHHRRRQRAVEHGAGAIMLGRVALEYEARRAPRRFAREVAKADPAA